MISQPASTCFRCTRQGLVSEDQRQVKASRQELKMIRFYCPKCLHAWTTDAEWAEAQGRFLDRARLR